MKLDYVALGENIRKHRLLANLTQLKLSEVVDCTETHIGQIERAKSKPSLEMTVAIANALGIGIDQLVYGDLKNHSDYFLQELLSLTEGFEGKDKLMSIEMTKSLIRIIRDFKQK